MLCIALALGQVAAETHSGKSSRVAPKKNAVTERAKSKHTQKSTKKPAEPRENGRHPNSAP